VANEASVLIKGKSFKEAAFERKKEFAILAKGGIFLFDSVKFVRTEYNYSFLKKSEIGKKYYTIKKGTPFSYYEISHPQDTLYCKSNQDTMRQYLLVYDLPTAGSNFEIGNDQNNMMLIVAKSLYFSIAHPLFYNARNMLQVLASIENLVLIASLIVFIVGAIKKKKDNFPPLAFMIFGLSLFIIIGITTPNSGALLRYRAPAAVFIIISALYYTKNWRVLKKKLPTSR
jgi:hypothetical protein